MAAANNTHSAHTIPFNLSNLSLEDRGRESTNNSQQPQPNIPSTDPSAMRNRSQESNIKGQLMKILSQTQESDESTESEKSVSIESQIAAQKASPQGLHNMIEDIIKDDLLPHLTHEDFINLSFVNRHLNKALSSLRTPLLSAIRLARGEICVSAEGEVVEQNPPVTDKNQCAAALKFIQALPSWLQDLPLQALAKTVRETPISEYLPQWQGVGYFATPSLPEPLLTAMNDDAHPQIQEWALRMAARPSPSDLAYHAPSAAFLQLPDYAPKITRSSGSNSVDVTIPEKLERARRSAFPEVRELAANILSGFCLNNLHTPLIDIVKAKNEEYNNCPIQQTENGNRLIIDDHWRSWINHPIKEVRRRNIRAMVLDLTPVDARGIAVLPPDNRTIPASIVDFLLDHHMAQQHPKWLEETISAAREAASEAFDFPVTLDAFNAQLEQAQAARSEAAAN